MSLAAYAVSLMLLCSAALVLCGRYGQRTFSKAERGACYALSILALFAAGVWIVP